MTEQRRRAILSQDSLSIKDVMELNPGISYGSAAKMIREFKLWSRRPSLRGRIHTLDYIERMNVDRDGSQMEERPRIYYTVCLPKTQS